MSLVGVQRQFNIGVLGRVSFRDITINLTGPICTCTEQAITWGIKTVEGGYFNLYFTCRECKTHLNVPHKKLIAHYRFDTPYPADRPRPKDPDPEPTPTPPPSSKPLSLFEQLKKDDA